MMKFKEGTTVKTIDGDKVGTIDHIVLDPTNDKVTHIVVRKGFLFTEDRVVPASILHTADDDGVLLDATREDFDTFPPYEETHYVQPNRKYTSDDAVEWDTERPLFFYVAPHAGMYAPMTAGTGTVGKTVRNVPTDRITLNEGTKVMTSDGEHAGDVEQTFTDEEGHITHILLSKGFIFTTERLIPAHWLGQMTDNKIQLNVRTEIVEDLPEYSV